MSRKVWLTKFCKLIFVYMLLAALLWMMMPSAISEDDAEEIGSIIIVVNAQPESSDDTINPSPTLTPTPSPAPLLEPVYTPDTAVEIVVAPPIDHDSEPVDVPEAEHNQEIAADQTPPLLEIQMPIIEPELVSELVDDLEIIREPNGVEAIDDLLPPSSVGLVPIIEPDLVLDPSDESGITDEAIDPELIENEDGEDETIEPAVAEIEDSENEPTYDFLLDDILLSATAPNITFRVSSGGEVELISDFDIQLEISNGSPCGISVTCNPDFGDNDDFYSAIGVIASEFSMGSVDSQDTEVRSITLKTSGELSISKGDLYQYISINRLPGFTLRLTLMPIIDA